MPVSSDRLNPTGKLLHANKYEWLLSKVSTRSTL